MLACILPSRAPAGPPLNTPPPAEILAPPARVVIVEDSAATDAFKAQPDAVRALLQRGITHFTRKTNPALAWRTLVSTQDVVGIKVFSRPGPLVGTRPEVVAAVVEGLTGAGVPTNNIVIWDRQLADLRRAGFGEIAERYGVRLAGAVDAGWDEKVSYDSALLGQLVYGDHEFQKKIDGFARKSFASVLVTRQISKIINVSPMLNHNSAGVCGSLYSLALGSVDNTLRFEGNTARLAEAVPDIYNLPGVGDHVALHIVDALICQYEGEEIVRLHCSIALNQLRFSKDPVALDVLSVGEIAVQRRRADLAASGRTNHFELYQNAALIELGTADVKKIDLEFVASPR